MDRNITGNGDFYRQHSRPPSRFTESPIMPFVMKEEELQRRRDSPNSYRGANGRVYESPPRHHPDTGGGFPFTTGIGGVSGVGFRPMGAGVGGYNSDSLQPPSPQPFTGQKRGFPFSVHGGSPVSDPSDRSNFAKLFIGSVPRTAVEEEVRPLFEEHGKVLEVALIKDKRTGQQQGCCFVKYATSQEADRAIRALHNQYTLPGGVGPIQVRYADGERERLGAVEYKLFVGSMNKYASEKEIEDVFAQYGRVEDVYLMRDELKQSRGCGFVKYANKEMAMAAINALNGIYVMRGCDQPLTVRFADPKRPRVGETRDGAPAVVSPGFAPRFQAPGTRPPSSLGDPTGGAAPNAWHSMNQPNLGPSPNSGIHGFKPQLPFRSGDQAVSSNMNGLMRGSGGSQDSFAAPSPSSPQSINHPPPQASLPQKPHQSSQDTPVTLQMQSQAPSGFPQSQTPVPAGQTSFNPAHGSQNGLGFNRQPSFQSRPLYSAFSANTPQAPSNMTIQQSNTVPTNQLPIQPPPSQLAQKLSQQTQSLRATFQSSQQAFSQLQQQVQSMQPLNQSLTTQNNSQAPIQQWTGMGPRSVANNHTTAADVPVTSSALSTATALPRSAAPAKTSWTEHTSPDGYSYYHNSVTGESKWEKPEELMLLEQQQKPPAQKPQFQSYPQQVPLQHMQPQVAQVQQVPAQQLQFQTQPRNPQQSHQPFFPSQYPASGLGSQNVQDLGRTQLSAASANAVNDPARYQQVGQATQRSMWNNKQSGT